MRRSRIALLSALALLFALSSTGFGQASNKVRRLGVLSVIDDPGMLSVALTDLAASGFVEGRNLVVDKRVGPAEQMATLARTLVGTGPDVIMATSDWAVYPAREATKSIPIVASPMGADPVAAGVAASWARPGGNVTGVTLIAPELEVKRLDLLREVVPAARRVAMLSMHREVTEPGEAPVREMAANLGITLVELYVERLGELREAFAAMRVAGAEALVIVPVPEFAVHAATLAELAMAAGLPTVCGGSRFAGQGCLMGYGPNFAELSRQAADYVVRILRGASPAELPIVGPTHYELAVNLATAKALGLTIPPFILARAEEVIE